VILLTDRRMSIQSFGGSFKGLLDEFHRRHDGRGTALDLVKLIADTFPAFRDEVYYEGTKGLSLFPSTS